MDEELDPVMMSATCHTDGCPVADIAFVAPMYPNATEPIYRAQCGQCDQAITDLVPVTA